MKMSGWLILGVGSAALGAWCGLRKPDGKSDDPPSMAMSGPVLPAVPDSLETWRRLSKDRRPEAVSEMALLLESLPASEVLKLLLEAAKDDPWPTSLEGTRLQALAERLVELDPDKALAVMSSRDSLEWPFADAFGRLAARADVSKGQEWAGRITGDEERAAFWRAFGAHVDDSRMETVLAGGMSAMESRAERWAREDLPACQAWAAGHGEVQARVARIAAERDPRQALAWVNSLPQTNAGELASVRGAVYETWAVSDPAAALAAFGQEPAPDSMSRSIRGIAKAMGGLPAGQVLAAMAANPDAALMQYPVIGSVAGGWIREMVERDPSASVSMLFDLPESTLRHDLIAKASSWWTSESTPELRQSLEAALLREPPGGNRDAVIMALVRGSAFSGDADTAFRWLAAQAGGGGGFDEKARSMAEALSESAPAALAEHWEKLPQGVRDAVWPELVNHWRVVDPVAADAWLKQATAGAGRE